MSELRFVNLTGDLAPQRAALELASFPHTDPEELISEADMRAYARTFPDGDWYYGTDIVVHPDYRRRGIGQKLYDLRKDLVRRRARRGIIAGGHIPGFADHKHRMSATDYVSQVAAGGIHDATLSFQLQNGFEARGVLENYIDDEATDGWSALIVWENPDYRAPTG
jgi:GNAT superfamily N-acetyltransferase